METYQTPIKNRYRFRAGLILGVLLVAPIFYDMGFDHGIEQQKQKTIQQTATAEYRPSKTLDDSVEETQELETTPIK